MKKPFTQLFLIHAFIKDDEGNAKQVPLVYLLMSGKRRKDYVAVLSKVKTTKSNLLW
jgi:hypothetical protein